MKVLGGLLGVLFALSVQAETKELALNKILAVHQIHDEAMASFDFFSAEFVHQCGGKQSNRFRSYSKYPEVGERKFTLVLAAFEKGYRLSVEPLSCEGNALKVGRIGLRQ